MQRHVLLLMLLVTSFATTPLFATSWQWLPPQRLQTLMAEGNGLWVVDVRDEHSFAGQHLEGSLNIPVSLLAVRHFPPQKGIVLVDDSLGLRQAREGAEQLVKKGHEKIFILDGGLVGWLGEGYPVAGEGGPSQLRPVKPEDVAWAQQHGVQLRLFDLRDPAERERYPLAGAELPMGKSLEEKVRLIRRQVEKSRKKGLAAKLDRSPTMVLVFPTGIDAEATMISLQRELPSGDIRYLEGGYVAWAANPEKTKLSTQGGCPTCPGGIPGGVK